MVASVNGPRRLSTRKIRYGLAVGIIALFSTTALTTSLPVIDTLLGVSAAHAQGGGGGGGGHGGGGHGGGHGGKGGKGGHGHGKGGHGGGGNVGASEAGEAGFSECERYLSASSIACI